MKNLAFEDKVALIQQLLDEVTQEAMESERSVQLELPTCPSFEMDLYFNCRDGWVASGCGDPGSGDHPYTMTNVVGGIPPKKGK